jgi:hypothetical protein
LFLHNSASGLLEHTVGVLGMFIGCGREKEKEKEKERRGAGVKEE